MQYVIKFSCRDFFIDNQITQEVARYKLKDDLTLKNLTIFDSALIPIYYEEDKKEENKKPKKEKVTKPNQKNANKIKESIESNPFDFDLKPTIK